MNPKHRAKLLEELVSLEKFTESYPVAKSIFPDIVNQVQALHKKVLYIKVEDKQNGLNLNANKIHEVRNFAQAAIKLKENFTATLATITKKEGNLWITLDTLTTAQLDNKLKSSLDLFAPFIDAIKAVIEGISGEGIFKKDLCKKIQQAIDGQYVLINEDAITLCSSYQEIKKLRVPILDQLIDNLKKYKGMDFIALSPNYQQFCTDLDSLFSEEAVLTATTYETEVSAWIKTVQKILKSLTSDKLAAAGIHIKLVKNSLNQQFAAIGASALTLVHQELEVLISSIKDDETLTIKTFAEELNSALASFKIPTASIKERAALKNTEYIRKQLEKINIKDIIISSVNINSPQFVVNQPSFKENLLQKLNDWKDGLLNSLAEGGDLILALDGCTVNGDTFKTGILNCTKIDSVHKILSALPFDELKLRGHKDLKIFNEKWNTPWKTAIAAIDIEKNIISLYKDDAEMLTNLYKNCYAYLPSRSHLIGTLNLSVGGKIDIAMEAVKKLDKKVNKISEEVKIIKDVNDLQTMGLGYNSMINEVDIIFKNIIEAHQDYVNRVTIFSIEYSNAYEEVNSSSKDFNKASDAVKAFQDSIWGAVKTIGTVALCATGVGAVGAVIGKVAAVVATKIIETGVTVAVDLVYNNVNIIEYNKLDNNNTTPFAKYLKYQLDGQVEVQKTLEAILKISEQIQNINRYIQFALDYKVNVNMEPLIDEYKGATSVLDKWLREQKSCINKYRQQSAKLNPLPGTTNLSIERNMYINIIAPMRGQYTHTNWQIICKASKFRSRLITLNLIRKTDFIDTYQYEKKEEADDSLKYLYDQKEIAVF